MHIRDTGHCDKREVVKKPTCHWIQTGVVDVVDFAPGELLVASLPSDQVPANEEAKQTKTGGATPVDDGVTEKEILNDVIVPATHPKADVQNGPLPELGCEIVLLVGIGHEGIVGGHHRNIEMHEVSEEG